MRGRGHLLLVLLQHPLGRGCVLLQGGVRRGRQEGGGGREGVRSGHIRGHRGWNIHHRALRPHHLLYME